MTQAAKAQEPSMEEILASIRRIIADDDASKTAKPAEAAALSPAPAVTPKPAPPPPPLPAANNQDDIDAMLAELDRPAKPVPPAAAAPKPAAAPAPEVLDLTEAMAAPKPTPAPGPAPNFRTIDGASDVVFADRMHEPAAEPTLRALEEARRQFTQAAMPDRTLLSNTASAAVDSAFNSLAHTVLVQNARTLEDLVKEMLRPMLKGWLDDNLPGLVERIVRAEIERVSRGRP
jgi:hypothetical protein